MKRIPLLLLAFIAIGTFALSSRTHAKEHGPLLVIDTANSNFGTVPNHGFAERTFLLKNAGDAPLHITQVRPTCGCTVAALADSVVAPGTSTKVEIKLSADNKPVGPFYKNVYITSNSRDNTGAWLKFYGRFVQYQAPTAKN